MRKLLSCALVLVLLVMPVVTMQVDKTPSLAFDITIQSDPMPPDIPPPGRIGLVPPTPTELLNIWA